MLVGDEVARREQQEVQHAAAPRAVPHHQDAGAVRLRAAAQLNRSLVHDLATGRYLQEKAPGAHRRAPAARARAIWRRRWATAPCARAWTWSSPPARPDAGLNAARATGSYERKLAALSRVPLLIIDDFGLKPLRAPADEDLHDLIAERYEQAATIVTSNLDFPSGTRPSHQPAAGQRERWIGCVTTPTAWCWTGRRTARPSSWPGNPKPSISTPKASKSTPS
jgi:hypothetical protein